MNEINADPSDKQKENFERYNKKLENLGKPPLVSEEALDTGRTAGATYLSSDPKYPSAIDPYPITISSLEQLKDLTKFQGDLKASARRNDLVTPEDWHKERSALNSSNLSERDERKLHQALRVSVLDSPERVPSYKGVLDERYFPMDATAFSVENIDIQKDHPLIIKSTHDPVFLNVGVLTLEPGGQMICEATVVTNVQKFIKK